jgi:hypothetical protein
MLFVTLRILSLIFFFVSDLLWVKPIKSGLPNYLLIFLRSIFTTITFITAWLIAQYIFYDESINYHLIEKEYPQDLVFYIEAILLCLFSFWGLYHFTASLKLNKFSFVAPLANLGFIFTILTSIAVYQINITNTQIIALVVFAITVIIILRKFQFSDFKILVVPIILTHFFWDTAVVFYPLIISKIGIIPFCLLMELCVLSSSGILVIVNSKIISWNLIKPHLIRAILMAAIICTAVFLFSSSLTYLSVIVVVTLGLLTKLIRLTYGYFILKERLNKTELIVLLLMVFGGMLASF